MTRRWTAWLLALSVVLALVVACSGGNPQPSAVSVSVHPDNVTLGAGETIEFTASVTGARESSVSWAASCGRLSGSGGVVVFTAPASVRTCSVSATSVEDSTRSAAASVTVLVGDDTETVASLDEDTLARDPSGNVEIEFPAGVLPEVANVRIGIGGDDAPAIATSVEAVVNVSGVGQLAFPVEMRFDLPGIRGSDAEYAVFRRSGDGGHWSELPSWVENNKVTALTGSFSTIGLFRIETTSQPAGYTISAGVLNDAGSEFNRLTFGTHFGNSEYGVGHIAKELDERINGLCYGAALVTADYFAANRSAPIARDFHGDDLRIQNLEFGELLVRRQDEQPFWRGAGEKFKTIVDPLGYGRYVAAGAETAFQLLQDGELVLLALWAWPNAGHAVLAYDVAKSYDADNDHLIYSFFTYDVNATGLAFSDSSHRITQYGSTFWVRIRNYHAHRSLPLTGRVDWRYDSGPTAAGFDPVTVFAYPVDRWAGALPWTNPVLTNIDASVQGQRIRVTPTMAHPDAERGASVTGIKVQVLGSDGAVVFSSDDDLTGASYAVDYDFEPGDYTVRVLVQDGQGNLSRAQQTSVTVHATRIEDVTVLTPLGTTFRPFEDLLLQARVVTNLPEVVVGAWLPSRDGTRTYYYRQSVFGPEAVIDLRYGVAAIAALDSFHVDTVTVFVWSSSGALLTTRAVPIDYLMVPQQDDLWLGWWDGSIAQTTDPDLMTDLTVLLMSPVPGDAGTGTIRTYDRDGQTDFVARGTLNTSNLSSTQLAGTLTCTSVSGVLYGWPVSSCYDIFLTPQSPFTATRSTTTHAHVTVEALAADDPAFTDIAVTKRLTWSSSSAIGGTGGVRLKATEAMSEGPGSACARGLAPCPVPSSEFGD